MADNYTFKDAAGNTVTHASEDIGSGVQASEHVSVDDAGVMIAKAEDAAHSSGDKGIMALAVRKDTPTALAGSDGDYIPLIVDSSGRLHVAPNSAAGDIAHDSADSGNPLKVGGYAKATAPTAVSDGDRVNAWFDRNGRLVVNIAEILEPGQAAMAASLPVVLASNHSNVPIAEAPSTSVVTGAIAASLTAAQLATVAAKLVRLKASPSNNGLIYIGPSSIANTVSDDQLIAYWKLQEASGTAYDSGPYTNDLAAYNAPVSATGKIDNGRAFVAASSQYLEIADNPYLSMGAGERLTIVAWVKPTTNAAQTIISKFGSAGSYEFQLDVDSTKFRWSVSADGTALVTATATNFGNISGGTWYFVCARYNGTTISISVNAGTPNTAAHTTDIIDAAQPFRIGARATGSPYANAVIDEVGIWKRALSDDEVTALYNSGAGLSYPYLPAGFQLAAGDDTGWLPIDNLNRLYQLGTNINDVLSYMVLA